MTASDFEKFIAILTNAFENNTPIRITLSKPRHKNDKLRCHISPFAKGHEVFYKVVSSSATQDFTETVASQDMANKVEEYLSTVFFFADVFSDIGDYSLMQSAKGKATLIKKKTNSKTHIAESHDHKKNYVIPTNSPFLYELGITNGQGKVLAEYQKKYRQINKFIEVLKSEIDHVSLDRYHIADMGSGKAYLTFAMHQYLYSQLDKNIDITGYELRNDLVGKCNQIALRLELKHLNFKQGNIGDISMDEKTNILIALHACDIATDMALAQAIEAEAELIIVSPCCHKQIRKEITILDEMTRHGIFLERQAEMITDTIRALILEQYGYRTKVFEFVSAEHTGKNSIITASMTNVKRDTTQEIKELKDRYGIKEHYLEKRLKN